MKMTGSQTHQGRKGKASRWQPFAASRQRRKTLKAYDLPEPYLGAPPQSDIDLETAKARKALPDATAGEKVLSACSPCRKVVFSDRAYAQIYSEATHRRDTETGGLLVGHYIGGTWYVVEATDPGVNAKFEVAYHEGDDVYQNHVIRVMSRTYKHPLVFLGMWHRHPGSLDRFSGTDDGTNLKYARFVGPGCVSLIVNMDPGFRMSVYFAQEENGRPRYSTPEVLVGTRHFDNAEVLELTGPVEPDTDK